MRLGARQGNRPVAPITWTILIALVLPFLGAARPGDGAGVPPLGGISADIPPEGGTPTLGRFAGFAPKPGRAIALLALLAADGMPPPLNPEPAIVPAVQQWRGGTGSLDIRGAPLVIAGTDEQVLRPTAELMQADLARMGLPRPEIIAGQRPSDKTAIVLVLTETPFAAGDKTIIDEQSYAVDIGGDAVTIAAHNRAGIFYGTTSILQMLAAAGHGAALLPRGNIVDGPVTRQRMLMLDVGRKSFPMETLDDYLRVLQTGEQ